MKQTRRYRAIRESHEEYGYPTENCCEILGVSRAAYYRWLSGKSGPRKSENERIARKVEEIHHESPDKGYRRISDELRHDHGMGQY